jgi:quercetin dioxygenase-like cupin family protein
MKEEHKKVWGKEVWLANTDLYCGKLLYLDQGYRCSIHYHKIKDETFYIFSGKVLMELEDFKEVMEAGSSVRVPPYIKHRFTGIEDSIIIEISTQHFEEDSYRETKSEKIKQREWLEFYRRYGGNYDRKTE